MRSIDPCLGMGPNKCRFGPSPRVGISIGSAEREMRFVYVHVNGH